MWWCVSYRIRYFFNVYINEAFGHGRSLIRSLLNSRYTINIVHTQRNRFIAIEDYTTRIYRHDSHLNDE